MDERELAEFQAEFQNADPAALKETYLMMPVRLRIGDVEMLRLRDAKPEEPAFLRLPLLHVATIGATCMRGLEATRESEYLLPGTGVSLLFHRTGSTVSVKSELNGQTAAVEMQELVDAVDSFVNRVEATLRDNIPAWRTSIFG